MTPQDIIAGEISKALKYIRQHKKTLKAARTAPSREEALQMRVIAYEHLNIYTRQLATLRKIQARMEEEC